LEVGFLFNKFVTTLNKKMSHVNVIGSGFSGLSSACYLSKQGNTVSVFEKNNSIGGRARKFTEKGFVFDMGPSWYWMPDIFERFFSDFGKTSADYYSLEKLSPSFQIFFKDQAPLIVPAELDQLYELFESIELGSSKKLKTFLKEGELKYNVAMASLIYKPALSWLEYATVDVISGALKSDLFKSMSSYIRSFFKDERLITLMEFPVIFLGAMPDKIPALYSLMNYSAFSAGTWYPKGGMFEIINAMHELALLLVVKFNLNSPIDKIVVDKKTAIGLSAGKQFYANDAVIASADYHHVEQNLLEENQRNYKKDYWNKRTMAPSCLIFYLGINKRIKNLLHHNLFFDTDFNTHASEIYNNPKWPNDPLFYVCAPSKTDTSVAPEGMENIFILIPLAVGLNESEEIHETYFSKVMTRLEKITGETIKDHVVYKKSYCTQDFISDYNAFKGNAYGLANTLKQTAVFKPSLRNKKINNLFYTGQLTVPGPGVPPSIISGKIAANEAAKYLNQFILNS